MNRSALAAIALICLMAPGCLSVHGSVHSSTFTTAPYGSLRHAVLFKFKEGTTPGQIRAVENALRQLPDEIGKIHGFEWGTEVSGRNLNKGFTHMALFTFDNQQDLAEYRGHEAHEDFLTIAMPYIDEIFVFDYWASD